MRRPMFRKGGSAGEGITSGLAPRQGYEGGKTVEELNAKNIDPPNDLSQIDIRNMNMQQLRDLAKQVSYKAPPMAPDTSLRDFKIDFGLDLISRTPGGNIFQTAGAAAKDPFAKFQQARSTQDAFDDKLALGAYDIVKAQDLAAKERQEDLDDMALQDKYKRGQIELSAKLKPPYEGQTAESLKQNLVETLTDPDSKQPRAIKDSAIDIANNLIDFQMKHPDKAGSLIYQPRWVQDTQGQIQLDESSIPVGGIFFDPTKNRFMLRKTNAKDRTAFVFIDEETLEEL